MASFFFSTGVFPFYYSNTGCQFLGIYSVADPGRTNMIAWNHDLDQGVIVLSVLVMRKLRFTEVR